MIIYQYRGKMTTNKQFGYFVKLIKNGDLMFRRPSEFNDPFDCMPTQVSEMPIGALPHFVVDSLINRNIQSVLSQMVGIACFTPHPDRMLMWSHYGDQHRSICVGFDSDELLNNVPKNSLDNPLYTELSKVTYTNTRPDENDKYALSKKSIEWCYEDEFRLMSYTKQGHPKWGAGVWRVPTSSLKEVILGARIESKQKDRICAAIQKYNASIEIKQAIVHSHSYEIVIENFKDQPTVGESTGFLLDPNGEWVRT